MVGAETHSTLQQYECIIEQEWMDGHVTRETVLLDALKEEGARIMLAWRTQPPKDVCRQRVVSVTPTKLAA